MSKFMAEIQRNELRGLKRCPQCGIANPRLTLTAQSISNGEAWAIFRCASCSNNIVSVSEEGNVFKVYPEPVTVSEQIPEASRNYLNQALASIDAPDGAVMLLGACVDSMLKEKGLVDGSVYVRIDAAVTNGILTKEMGEWAHAVRLGSNRPRHADKDAPHVTKDEAKLAVEYVLMLGELLYVLPNTVANGMAAALAGKPLA